MVKSEIRHIMKLRLYYSQLAAWLKWFSYFLFDCITLLKEVNQISEFFWKRSYCLQAANKLIYNWDNKTLHMLLLLA